MMNYLQKNRAAITLGVSLLMLPFAANAADGGLLETAINNLIYIFKLIGLLAIAICGVVGIFHVATGFMGLAKDRNEGGEGAGKNWKKIGIGICLTQALWLINASFESVVGEDNESDQYYNSIDALNELGKNRQDG